jgi:acetyltransferase-like isoleucine patch superfamily enzyme
MQKLSNKIIPWPPKRGLINAIFSKDPFGVFLDILSIVYSRIRVPGVKIIRIPFRINSRKSQFKIGDGAIIGKGAKIDLLTDEATINIGANFTCGDNLSLNIASSLIIGENALLSRNVFIVDNSHGSYGDIDSSEINSPPSSRNLHISEIVIGNNVWVGESVKILKGVKIGNSCIINAGCVVSKDIPDYCVISAANPIVIQKLN